jgi:hypothetical protein
MLRLILIKLHLPIIRHPITIDNAIEVYQITISLSILIAKIIRFKKQV